MEPGRRGAEFQAKGLKWIRYRYIVEDFDPQGVTHLCWTLEGEAGITLVSDWRVRAEMLDSPVRSLGKSLGKAEALVKRAAMATERGFHFEMLGK